MKYLVLMAIVFISGCITIYNPATQQKEFYFIDERTEVSLGRNLATQILREKRLVKDKKVLSLIKEIGKKLSRVSDRSYLNYEFFVLDAPQINAFALPGGYIFVNKGTLDIANRDELAFVLAHEIAHVCARHSLKKLQASLGMELILSLALRKPAYIDIKKGVSVLYKIVALGYSRSDEFLADTLGVKYVSRAGFEPSGAVTLLRKMEKEGGKGHLFVFLSSHPDIESRVENIQKELKKLNGTFSMENLPRKTHNIPFP